MWCGVSQVLCERNRLIGVLLVVLGFVPCLFTQALESDKSNGAVERSLEWWVAQFPMSNDSNFLPGGPNPTYPDNDGPAVTIDGGHNNFHVITNLIKPLFDTLSADGYNVTYSMHAFTEEVLKGTDILVVMSAMSSDFRQGEPYAGAFEQDELAYLEKWVAEGGSLLVFSEHFPFDRAVKPLLRVFGIETSVGVTVDNVNNDGKDGLIVFEGKRLDSSSALVAGKRRVDRLVSWGGSALTGDNYANVLLLSDQATNKQRGWGDAIAMPEGRGNSQGLAGHFGNGKIAAFGDSNGFVAMVFDNGDGTKDRVGMNSPAFGWYNFVLNTFDWLSDSAINSDRTKWR